jgi:hypothetical protein
MRPAMCLIGFVEAHEFPRMTVLLITALRAAETLTAFHRQRVETAAAGEDRVYHIGMARQCADDAERITREILGSGLTVENQATEMRRRDLEKAHRIIDRHHYARHGHAARRCCAGQGGDGAGYC